MQNSPSSSPSPYTVTVGQYTNKKRVTKDWLFIREPGNARWNSDILLNPGQCAALLANLGMVTAFAGKTEAKPAAVALTVLPSPVPSPSPVSETTSEPLPALEPTPKTEPKPDPKNAAGQTDITQHVNPKVAALIAKAMGNKRKK